MDFAMHLYDTTRLAPEDERRLDELLGATSWWRTLWQRDRIGPPRLAVAGFSAGFEATLGRELGPVHARLVARPRGLVVGLLGPTQRACWAIPFHELAVYKAEHLSLHAGGQFLRLEGGPTVTATIRALLERQARYLGGA